MRPTVPVLAMLVALALIPAAAQAAPGNDTFIEATSFSVAAGQVGWETATCPGGSRVVSGGASTTGAAPEGDADPYRLMLSGPLDASGLTANTDTGDVAQRWYAYVHNNSDGERLFKVFAVCSRTSDAVVQAVTRTVTNLFSDEAEVQCPAGSRAVGGGLGTTGPVGGTARYGLMLSGPQDETGETDATVDGDVARRWSTYVFNASTGPQVFKTFALCSEKSDATLAVGELPVAQDNAGLRVVRCPADSRVLGGGIHATGPTPAGQFFVPYLVGLNSPLDESGTTADTEDGDEPRFWYSYARNVTVAQATFKVSAICAPDDQPPGGGGGKGGGGGPGGGAKGVRCAGRVATIVGTNRGELLRGTRRGDVIVARGGSDRVIAGRGNDLVCGGSGNDRLAGGSGNDRLFGSAGKDALLGEAGRDRLLGGDGRDRLAGGSGRDRLVGGAGRDRQRP